jgi:REP element-mobilizing transposase RayT
MHDWESMSHVWWKCKYHVVFICSSNGHQLREHNMNPSPSRRRSFNNLGSVAGGAQ